MIQGGMGAAVSGWRLASAVSSLGQLGVVSGVALGIVLARGLQDGDPGGHRRRALEAFPDEALAGRVLERYYRSGGRAGGRPYRSVPVPRRRAGRPSLELTVAAGFVEVYLAKEGHDGEVGINLLEKIQIPTLPTLYGAMLAGVDWVLMGAGIPINIPVALDRLAEQAPVALPLSVVGASAADGFTVEFDPRSIVPNPGGPVTRPRFIAIVGSHVLAAYLANSDIGRPSGFVVELPLAGGHNAPPRGRLQLNEAGEPVYGPRDAVDLERLRALGLPFWLAGGYAHPEKLREALDEGAAGIQVGTAFALCDESGLAPDLKRLARELAAASLLEVRTDPVASPTGYPFKVAQLPGTVSDRAVYEARQRRCDLSFLPTLYRCDDGTLGYRCPAEPVDDYRAKGGEVGDTVGRTCLCNGLIATAGLPQLRPGEGLEPAIVTLGDDACALATSLSPDGRPYSAADVLRYLLGSPALVT